MNHLTRSKFAVIILHVFCYFIQLLNCQIRPNYLHPLLFDITDSTSSFDMPWSLLDSDNAYSAAEIKTDFGRTSMSDNSLSVSDNGNCS